MEIKDLRKLKITFFKEDGSQLSLEEVDRLLEKAEDSQEKWFLRGVKHILENHYTEAIKRFQLVDDEDARFLILCCAYKIKDDYILQEYKNSFPARGMFLKRFNIRPSFVYDGESIGIDVLSHLL